MSPTPARSSPLHAPTRRSADRLGRTVAATLATTMVACVPVVFGPHVTPGTSGSPAIPWVPPAELRLPAPPPDSLALPAGITLEQLKGHPLTLPDAVKLALEYNPNTHDAWLRAVAQADQLGVARSAWYPTLNAGITGGSQREPLAAIIPIELMTASPTVNLSYLVLDFGARQARVDEARDELIAANWTHDAAIQDVVLQVEQSYYQLLNANAQLEVQRASAREERASLDAAVAREQAGLATVADVLQARTAYTQVLYNIVTVEGQIHTYSGALAVSMGLPPQVPFTVGPLPEQIPLTAVRTAVDEYLKRGVALRPELGAARIRINEAQARISEMWSSFLPSISFEGSLERLYYWTPQLGSGLINEYSALLTLNVPIFSGFSSWYGVQQAKVQAADAQAQVDALQQQVQLQVWTSYYALVTAEEQMKAARDLLASAKASYDVAAGQYTVGLGNIINLLTAQSALVTARGQDVQARSTWFIALSQLAHDTGALGLPGDEGPVAGVPAAAKP